MFGVKRCINSLIILIVVVISSIALKAEESSVPEWKKTYNEKQVRQNFNEPPLWYAPHTFWFWDAPLDAALSTSMAKKMTTQSLNPGYAHPRHSGAPDKPYPSLPKKEWLSPLWFDSFGMAVDVAEKAGMTLGYCDEYWWPSGQAAGRVLQKHPELRAQSLKWTKTDVQGPGAVTIPESKFTVAGKVSKDNKIISKSLRIIGSGSSFQWKIPKGKWTIFSYNTFYHPGRDMGEVNYIDPKLMDVFIPIAHESYEKNMGSRMGRSIPGVFVDNEGDFGWKMAWSDYLAERYKELKKSDIRLWMPLLTEKDEEGLWVKARCDWFDVVSDVYTNKFLGTLNDWLAKRNMYYISNLWEETLILQSMAVGDFMRSQRRVTMPGNDCLQMKSQQVHDFKETQSVCEFENKPFMSEIMGVAGWVQTPVQMKMTINAVTAWGITHTVPHGINLNRKLGTMPYPADWFDENPYWRYMHLWTDFARRASFVNRQGMLVSDILLYNPLKSVWALSDGYFTSASGEDWDSYAGEINNIYAGAMDVLTKSHLDYLICDDHYLSKAALNKSSTKNSRTNLTIADHNFSVLVLPSIFIIPRESSKKILAFAKAGGIVVILGDLPKGSMEKGTHDPIVKKEMAELLTIPTVVNLSTEKNKMALLPRKISAIIEPQIKFVSGDFPLISSHRKIGNSDFYWLVNNTEKQHNCTLSFRDGRGRAEKWDCENGTIYPIDYQLSNNRNTLKLNFEPYEAFWLVFNGDQKMIKSKNEIKKPNRELVLKGPWKLTFPETDTIKMTSSLALITLDTTISSEIISTEFNDINWPWLNIIGSVKLVDTWQSLVLFNKDPESKRFYRYTFNLDDKPDGALLNVNGDNQFRFWINGKAVKPGIYSSTMAKVDVHDIKHLLHKGENLLAVEETNHVGYGWFLAQGSIQFTDGSKVNIYSNDDWLESQTETSGWTKTDFDDSSWHKAILADKSVTGRELRSLARPQKVGFSKNVIWWRMPLPPGTKEVILPGISQKAKVWLDGKPAQLKKEKLKVNDNSKMLVIKNFPGENGLSEPAVFICKKSAQRSLGSWLDIGLRRFTGFIDYEKEFDLPQGTSSISIDLGKTLHMAEVWINGKKIGERLWPPFRFSTADNLHEGKNKIVVRVGNLMVNEMGLYDDLEKLRTWGWDGAPPDSCFDAGLFGPVKIMMEK